MLQLERASKVFQPSHPLTLIYLNQGLQVIVEIRVEISFIEPIDFQLQSIHSCR
jgi:hypothetical protein